MKTEEERRARRRETQRSWRLAHAEQINAKARKYREDHPEEVRKKANKRNLIRSRQKKNRMFGLYRPYKTMKEKEVMSLNSRGKDIYVIALRLNLTTSKVQQIIKENS